MRKITNNFLALLAYLTICWCMLVQCDQDATVAQWLATYNATASNEYYLVTLAKWVYNTNVTDANREKQAVADARFAAFQLQANENASQFHLDQIQDPTNKRRIKFIQTVGINLSDSDTITLSSLVANMTSIYSESKICAWINEKKNCSVKWALDPDIFNVMAKSRDYDMLTYVWEAWRNVSINMGPYFEQMVLLLNKGARQGGFNDTGVWWRSWYESSNFTDQVQELYYQILPLYEELHTYVRRQLRWIYPELLQNFTIPAHLLGNMWAQEWQNIFDFTQPFPGKQNIDVTEEMKHQNYTPLKMFHTADKFFQSLGLIKMSPAFWGGSIITKPKDRDFVCHASAWNFYNNHDYRIKMCTNVGMNDFITLHHEMGHIQYYMQYSGQPVTFKNGANPGFHEAIGDTIALSVRTPKHLNSIGLLPNYVSDKEQDLNYQYRTALEKIAFLPFAFVMDAWRWGVFNGSYTNTTWNSDWWKLRNQLQGLSSPVARPSNAFDPGAKSHIASDTPYIRYFVSFIVQFQFYKAMCKAANHRGPLYKCDFYNSTAAGKKLAAMLKMGSSKPWPDAMKVLTGSTKMDASVIKEYFQPIMTWLRQKNIEAGDCYGWGYDQWPPHVMRKLKTPRCGSGITNIVEKWLDQYT